MALIGLAPTPRPSAELVWTVEGRGRLRLGAFCGRLSAHGWVDPQKGALRPEVEHLGKASVRLAGKLDRLGMTPTARARLGLDLARTVDLATAMSEPDPNRRRDLLAEAGLEGEPE